MSFTEFPPAQLDNAASVATSAPATAVTHATNSAKMAGFSKLFAIFIIAALLLSILSSAYLWRRLTKIQEHLARQSGEATTASVEARVIAKNAQDLAREAVAKIALTENKVAEVALQRGQLDELMQSLSRSRDENLVVDIESALRLAQQQAQLTSSMEPLLAALKTADNRLARSAQPRLNGVRRALASDTERVKATVVADMPALLIKLDELNQLVDDLPMQNTVPATTVSEISSVKPQAAPTSRSTGTATAAVDTSTTGWQNLGTDGWQRAVQVLRAELLKLVRVSRINHPDAVLLTPEQSFFWRENLKLKLLNARLSLLSRHIASSKADLAAVSADVAKYSSPTASATQRMLALLKQVQTQINTVNIPALDDTLAALSVAALATTPVSSAATAATASKVTPATVATTPSGKSGR